MWFDSLGSKVLDLDPLALNVDCDSRVLDLLYQGRLVFRQAFCKSGLRWTFKDQLERQCGRQRTDVEG